jgi:hypothetical protein
MSPIGGLRDNVFENESTTGANRKHFRRFYFAANVYKKFALRRGYSSLGRKIAAPKRVEKR